MPLTAIKQRNTKSNVLIEQNIVEINQLYEEGMSLTKIGKKFSICRKSLSKLLKNNKLKVRKGFYYARKYNLNEHYFDIIDSEDKAYILGFIYADGNNLYKLNRISIQLSIVDKDILQKISNIIYDEEVLKLYKRKNNKGKEFEYVAFNICSKHISEHFATLGVIENKSYKINYPEWLDKFLYRHFIRGLIDGDGWISIPKSNRDSPNVGLICTRSINNFLLKYYKDELNINSYLTKAHKQDINVMCEIRIKNYHQCKIFLDWIYRDATIYLDRKYDLYKNFLDKYENLRAQNK